MDDNQDPVPRNPTRPWWRRLADNLGPVAPTDDDGWIPLNRGRWCDDDPDEV